MPFGIVRAHLGLLSAVALLLGLLLFIIFWLERPADGRRGCRDTARSLVARAGQRRSGSLRTTRIRLG